MRGFSSRGGAKESVLETRMASLVFFPETKGLSTVWAPECNLGCRNWSYSIFEQRRKGSGKYQLTVIICLLQCCLFRIVLAFVNLLPV